MGRPRSRRAKIDSQITHILLTLVVGWAVVFLTQRPLAMVPLLFSSWLASVFMFAAGPLPLWRVVAAAATAGVIVYLLARFVLPGWP